VEDRVVDRLVLSASLTAIDDARRWSSAHARSAAVDEETIQDLELAMTEALSNTIRHGYCEASEEQIELTLDIDCDRIAFTILDRGEPFDPAAKPEIDLENPGEGGYGLYLMEELTDELSRTPGSDGGTLVTLVKYRKEQ
jgi:serine/threonine-protein kinase RsbW